MLRDQRGLAEMTVENELPIVARVPDGFAVLHLAVEYHLVHRIDDHF